MAETEALDLAPGLEPASAEAIGLPALGLEQADTLDLAPGFEPVSPPSDALSYDDGLDPDTRREAQDAWDVVFGINEAELEKIAQECREKDQQHEGFHCESTDVFLEEIE